MQVATGIHDLDCGIQVDELVKGVLDIVADLRLLVLEVHLADALVGLGDLDSGTHLAFGVKNLRCGDAHAGLPAVSLRLHAVNEIVERGAEDLLVVGVRHRVSVGILALGHLRCCVGQGRTLFYVVKSKDAGDSGTEIDTGESIAVTGLNLR